ncbi:hypothetical protein [Nesterenkonia sp. CF4.4]|uniref:hypothetical protein n=1 Tax=Nesterenkonia sp. CF4.4 TaxID=3373079 RepID=UPI003EE4A570
MAWVFVGDSPVVSREWVYPFLTEHENFPISQTKGVLWTETVTGDDVIMVPDGDHTMSWNGEFYRTSFRVFRRSFNTGEIREETHPMLQDAPGLGYFDENRRGLDRYWNAHQACAKAVQAHLGI